MAGALAAIGSMAGGLSQGLSAETQQALQRLQAQAMRDSQQGSQQAGQILSQLYGGPQGQPQQGGLGGLGGILKGLFTQPGQGPNPQPQQASQFAPPQQAPQGGPQGGPPPQPMGSPGGQPQPAPGPPQQGPQGPPTAQSLQMMQLPEIVQAAKRVNPNMTPQQLMSAIDRLTPIMNAQALQQYRLVQQQLAGQRIQATERGQDFTHEDRQAGLGERGREADQRVGATERGQDLTHEDRVRGQDLGHEDRKAGLDEKKFEFRERQQGIKDRFTASLAEKFAALKQAKGITERRNIVQQAEASIKDSLAAERAKIAAANVIGPERDALMKEAAKAADDARDRVAAAAKVKASSDANETTSGAPTKPEGDMSPKATNQARVKVRTPEEAQALSPGTVYETPDGQQFTR